MGSLREAWMKDSLAGLTRRSRRLRKTLVKGVARLTTKIRNRADWIRYRKRGVQDLETIRTASLRLNDLPRPDFIIIGAPKCGTSWLQRALAQHPQILMVPDEIEYFSMHIRFPLSWYLSHFSRQKRTAQLRATPWPTLIGEKSARYCSISLDRLRLVREVVPDAKFILMTRDPVARHWSHAKRFFSKRRFNKREGGVQDIPHDELFSFFDSTRDLGQFTAMISRWNEAFSPHQLLVLSQEQALVRPKEAYDAVLAHIGASIQYDPSSIKVLNAVTNVGPQVKMPDDVAAYLNTMYAHEKERLQALFNGRPAIYAGS